ncbi:hypothetical protein KC356_g290 [Hortaea werneckii]|nr:hypothetical protein KC356_g290 [Hortaea werneckii]
MDAAGRPRLLPTSGEHSSVSACRVRRISNRWIVPDVRYLLTRILLPRDAFEMLTSRLTTLFQDSRLSMQSNRSPTNILAALIAKDLHAEPQPGCAALVCSILAANAERLFRERRIVSRRSRGFDIHRRFAYAIESQKPRHSVIANTLVRKLKTVVVALSFDAPIDLRLV